MDLTHYYHELHSKRFFYRKLTQNDVESWLDFYQNNPNLQYLGINLNRTDEEMAKAWVHTQMKRYENNAFGQLGIVARTSHELVGTIGYIKSSYCEEGEIEKATAIKPTYWRRGIGIEASMTLIDAVFHNNLASAIIGKRHIDNMKSMYFYQRMGFRDIRTIKEEDREIVKFRLTKEIWRKNDFWANKNVTYHEG